MTISKDFVNIYKKYLREINDIKRSIKYIEHMKRKVEKKQLVANEEEIYLVEKQQLTKDDEFYFDYKFGITTAAGIFIVIMLLSYCIAVAVRVIKLFFLTA